MNVTNCRYPSNVDRHSFFPIGSRCNVSDVIFSQRLWESYMCRCVDCMS